MTTGDPTGGTGGTGSAWVGDSGTCDSVDLGDPYGRECAPSTSVDAECTLGLGDRMYVGSWSADWGCRGKRGRFTAFEAAHPTFVPDDGSYPPELHAYGTDGAWAQMPDLVAAGDVVLYLAGQCGPYACDQIVVVTDPLGQTLLVVGSGLGSVAGWSAALGAAAGTCPGGPPAYTPACQECQANVPVRVIGPSFDAEAWQSESVASGGFRLSVGEAFLGSGDYLCYDGPGMDLFAWFVVPVP